MKLAKYLADYITEERRSITRSGGKPVWDTEKLLEIIQQGIEAFESTEDARVDICFEDMTCEHSFIDADNEGVYGFEVCRYCGWRQHK